MMNNENGRSMVEMLGVLAIIGVLSVAGIAGYSMAMRKYRANEIVNTASQLVVLAQAQNQGTGGKVYAGTAASGFDNSGINVPSGVTTMTADCQTTPGTCTVKVTTTDTEALTAAKNQVGTDGVGTYYTLSS